MSSEQRDGVLIKNPFIGEAMKTKKCPVCDWEIKDGGIKVKVAGKEITVCCDDCAKKAKEEPAKYAEK